MKILQRISYRLLLPLLLFVTYPMVLSGEMAFERVVSVSIDTSLKEDHPIGNRFSNVSLWHYLGTSADERMFHEWAEQAPAGWLKKEYPWLEEVQVYTASGGAFMGHPQGSNDAGASEFNRDLFVDPADRSVLDDYDFSPLVRACRNMLRQGVKPCLKLHNVPIKYTSDPKLDWFRLNVRPPDDYEVYADYISALVQAMVDAFGIEEVGTWRWYVGTEKENVTWWEHQDGTPESTAKAFLKFYDWSVHAVERVLGRHTGPIGVHFMMGGNIFWDPELFFAHARSGRNHATGAVGSRVDFLGISQYDRTAADVGNLKEYWPELKDTDNVLGTLSRRRMEGVQLVGNAQIRMLRPKMEHTYDLLRKYGYQDLPVEVSEGGMIYGTDGKWLWHGLAYGGSFDATWTALSFEKMLDTDLVLWSRWPLYRTSGLFHGLETAATNAMRLMHRMSDDHRVPVNSAAGASRTVASVSPDESTVRVLAFHHAPRILEPNPTELISLNLENLPFDGRVQVKLWRVDSEHGDFWPQWERDRVAHGITDADYYQSRDQPDPAHALLHQEHIDFWFSKEDDYRPLSRLPKPYLSHPRVSGGKLQLNFALPCFGVFLVEITQPGG